jgi:hypothetical protein
MTHAPDDYALVIGINHYPNWADGSKSLKGPVEDAKDFWHWLVCDRGGGLSHNNARLVLSTKEPVFPRHQIIDDELRAIRELARGKARRRFYFYFAGHGYSPATSLGMQSLCLANWSTENQAAALLLESYLNTAVGCLGFEEGLFFLDCCRLRAVIPLGSPSELACGDPKLDEKHHITYYSTEHYQAGYEAETSENVRGYFTRALLTILRNGTIEAQDLANRLYIDVPDLAKPKKQVARALRYAERKIFLGPPGGPPPPDLEAKRAWLSISLDTNLKTDIEPEEPNAPLPGVITVIQGDSIRASSRGQLSTSLSHGQYRVRIAHGEAVENYEIDIHADMHIIFPLPLRTSGAPLWGTVDKQEIITDPVVQQSKWDADGEQAIFVAYRSRHGATHGEIKGELHIESPYSKAPVMLASGLALLPLPEGMYLLSYKDENGSLQCLSTPIAKGWDTQLFIVEDHGRPVLENSSIFMQAAGKGFDPADGLIDAYELAIADLVTGGPGPDRLAMDHLLEGKFRNPLFGLVGGHFLIRELKLSRRRDAHRHRLLDVVIANVGRLLGENTPDVFALRLLRAQLNGERISFGFPSELPLLQVSFQALIEGAAHDPNLLGIWFDDVALGRVHSSPWICWREQPPQDEWSETDAPGRYRKLEVRMTPGRRIDAIEQVLWQEGFEISRTTKGEFVELRALLDHSDGSSDHRLLRRLVSVPNWAVDLLKAEIEQSRRRMQDLSMEELVRRTGLPRGLMEVAKRIATVEIEPHNAPRRH